MTSSAPVVPPPAVGPSPRSWTERARRFAWPATVIGLVVLAAIIRLPNLTTRATWDADQGHDMAVLTAFVRDGVWPLLGPPTSIGDFHHGALYYYALAPAALVGGGDPMIVVGEIAILGSLAVGFVAMLARSIAGRVAGFVGGLVMAGSATAIDSSTFLWNPNLVAFSSALSVWAAWHAWTTRRVRWWLLVAGALAATMQFHVLGVVLVPAFAVWLVADLRRRSGLERRRLVRVAEGSLAIIAVSYLPLVASELQTDLHETRAAIAYLVSGGQAVAMAVPLRLTFVSIRVLAWPLTGLITDGLAAGTAASVGVVALVTWRFRSAQDPERPFMRWLGATIAWSCLALGFGVAGLATVTPLPVDHYHAFLDPLVFLAVGIGVGTLWSRETSATRSAPPAAEAVVPDGPAAADAGAAPPPRARELSEGSALLARRALTGALLAVLVVWNVTHWPPSTAPDGGYPAAEVAAARVATQIGDRVTLVESLPVFKSAEAYTYPLERLGVKARELLNDPLGLDSMVVICDSLFVPDCGGRAEDPQAAIMREPRLVDRFVAAPGRTISVYLGTPGG